MNTSDNIKYIADLPLGMKHIRIVATASLGQMVGTAVATMVSVIIPMIQILAHPELSSVMQGVVGAIDLVGIAVGSLIFGRLSDRYGYLLFFRLCPLLILLASVAAVFFTSIPMLVICLFMIGFGIGGEYSLDSNYISELMPKVWRQRMVGVAKSASALGNIIAAALCFWVITEWRDATVWPQLFWIIAAIGAIMILTRIRFYQSPKWLIDHGRTAEAESAAEKFFGSDVAIRQPVATDSPSAASRISFFSFFKENWKQVIFSGIPWACEGLGVYGIGVFLPVLVMSLGLESADVSAARIFHVASSVEITLWISCIILPGFIIGLLLLGKISALRQEVGGFIWSGISLLILFFAYHYGWSKWIAIGSFMAFELFLNIGPHLMTYVLPSRIYPVADRGQGTGIAASIGKVGAVLGVFFIPLLLEAGGATAVLLVSAGVMFAGGIVALVFGKMVLPSSGK